MKGTVKLRDEATENIVKFADINSDEGVASADRTTRIKLNSDFYLQFTVDCDVFVNVSSSWPNNLTGRISKFKLIVEEI